MRAIAEAGAARRVNRLPDSLRQFLPENRNIEYNASHVNEAGDHDSISPAQEPSQTFGAYRSRGRREKEKIVWIRRNSLKSPESAKGIQGNSSDFIWYDLVLFGQICIVLCGERRPPAAAPLHRPSPAPRTRAASGGFADHQVPSAAPDDIVAAIVQDAAPDFRDVDVPVALDEAGEVVAHAHEF
jgi:hypothetical protein